MITKLTLTLEDTIIERAKKYAKKTKRSLSDIIESYLDSITQKKEVATGEMNDDLKKLFGATKIPAALDHKKEMRKIMQAKHK